MKSQLYQRLIFTISTLSLASLMGTAAHGSTSQPTVQFTTDPPLQRVIPAQTLVDLNLKITDSQGRAIKAPKVHLQIQPPKSVSWLTSTPPVTNLPLFNLEAVAADGTINIQQVFPLQGTYRLLVTATPTTPNTFQPIQHTLSMTVPDNPHHRQQLAIVVAALFGLSWIGGWLFTSQPTFKMGQMLSQPVRGVLGGSFCIGIVALYVINASAERIASGEHTLTSIASLPAENASTPVLLGAGLKLKSQETTRSGELATLSVQAQALIPSQPVPTSSFTFSVKTIQINTQAVTFAYETIAPKPGQFTWQQQFWQPTPHRIEVTARPHPKTVSPLHPITVSRTIDVQAVSPSRMPQFITLAYLATVAIAGFGLGLWQHHQLRRYKI